MTKMIQTVEQAIEAAAEVAENYWAVSPIGRAVQNTIAVRIRTLTAHIAAPDEVGEKRRRAVDKAVWEAENNWDGSCYTITKETFDDVLVLATEAALASTPIPLVDPVREAETGVTLNKKLLSSLEMLANTPMQLDLGSWSNHVNSVQEALSRIEELEAALEKCRDRFREYAASHEAKSTDRYGHIDVDRIAKAARNREMAELCDRALGSPAVGDGGGNG